MSSSFQDLLVWQRAMELVVRVYELTKAFPREETYGLTAQLRRAVISVPSNIAEGKGRHSDRDFVLFLRHARGSLLEVETQILIAERLGYVGRESTVPLLQGVHETGRLLNGLINRFSPRKGEH